MKKSKTIIEQFEKTLTIQNKKTAIAGHVFIILSFFLTVLFLCLRGYDNMKAAWGLNIGLDLLCEAACIVVYYSCLLDSAGVGERNTLFLSLLIASDIGVFLNSCIWIVQGLAGLAFWNRLANALLYTNTFIIVVLFWRYEIYALDVKEEISRSVNGILRFLLIPAIVCNLINIIFPLFFSVDEAGLYHRESLFPVCIIILIPVYLGITAGIHTSKSPKRDKTMVASFIGLPLAALIINLFSADLSPLEPSIFVSIMIIYLIMVTERGKKIAVTQTELQMASDIQASMLPHDFPPFPDRQEFDIYASMDPAREVGGDFYDFFLVDDNHLAVLIGDVSDKGVPAALFMMSTKNLINYRARQGGTPAEILTDINRQISHDNDSKMFITIWMGILDIMTGVLTCTNAGHEYPAVLGQDGVFRIFRDKHGVFLGAMEKAKYLDYELMMNPGDKVFVYTDGVPEANNDIGEQYGLKRLETALNLLSAENPRNILRKVRIDIDEFVGDASQFDDLTMLCLEYKGNENIQYCP